jgi:hypothetical protein
VSIGIPYAYGEVTRAGLIRTCPVCGERILERREWFDENGEHRGKDNGAPDAYQLHYLVEHEGQAAV